jgi:hypothetical protein
MASSAHATADVSGRLRDVDIVPVSAAATQATILVNNWLVHVTMWSFQVSPGGVRAGIIFKYI